MLYAGLDYTRSPPVDYESGIICTQMVYFSEINAVEIEMNGRTNLPEAFDLFRQTLSPHFLIRGSEQIYMMIGQTFMLNCPSIALKCGIGCTLLNSQSYSRLSCGLRSGVLKLKLSGSVEAPMVVRSTGYRLQANGDVNS